MQHRIAQGIHRHGCIHRRAGQAHAHRFGLRQFNRLIQAAVLKQRLERCKAVFIDLSHPLHIGKRSGVRDAHRDLAALLREHLHDDTGGHVTGENRILRRAQRSDQLLMLMQIGLRQHGFAAPLRIAETFVRENIRCLLRQSAGAEKHHHTKQQCHCPSLHH